MVATLTVATIVAGCSHSSAPTVQHHGAPSVSPRTNVGAAATGQYILGTDPGPVALGAHHLYYPSSEKHEGSWNQVIALPLGGGKPSTVARTQFSDGFINWVAAANDGWVYYVDQSHKQSDTDPKVLWRVIGIDPGTGHKRMLASNGNTPDAYVPIVRAEGNWAFWTAAEQDKTAREQLWTPGWPEPRDLLRHTEMTPGSESILNNSLVYLGPAATGATGHTVGGDCWAAPFNGGRPSALTHSGLALSCSASDDWLVWSQHIGDADTPPADDGVLDDPYKVWAQRDGGSPVLLHQGYISLGSIYVAQGKAIWQTSDGIRVMEDLGHPPTQDALTEVGPVQSAAVTETKIALAHREDDKVVATIIDLSSPKAQL